MRKGEIVLSDAYAEKLKISPGDEITYFGTTMEGSMVFQNFVMTGTINFGSPLLDKGTFIMDIKDAQDMLDMEDGTGELLGYFNSKIYNDIKALQIAEEFNSQFINSKDEYAPIMVTLKQQNDLKTSLDFAESFNAIFIFIFIFAMSLVLWNTRGYSRFITP